MRCMNINQSKMYYSSYESKNPVTDDYGNRTGEYEPVYGKPQEFYAYVSPEKGEVLARRYGETTPYDRVLVLDNQAPIINEQSRLWVDITPELDNEGNLSLDESGEVITPHDFIVKKVSKSLNSRLIAIRKINVSV